MAARLRTEQEQVVEVDGPRVRDVEKEAGGQQPGQAGSALGRGRVLGREGVDRRDHHWERRRRVANEDGEAATRRAQVEAEEIEKIKGLPWDHEGEKEGKVVMLERLPEELMQQEKQTIKEELKRPYAFHTKRED